MNEKIKRNLTLRIQPRIIEHLGIQMYQKIADVLSEFVANAWDADATIVNIIIDKEKKNIIISDNGYGMTFKECQQNYLMVGRNRRISLKCDTTAKNRPVMGRKGIGKFAGFGISNKIKVRTISLANIDDRNGSINTEMAKVETEFILDLLKIESNLISDSTDLITTKDEEPTLENCGTTITLENIQQDLSEEQITSIRAALSRRFIIAVHNDDFKIIVNGIEATSNFEEGKEYNFPQDLKNDEKDKLHIINIRDGWGVSYLENLGTALWRVSFTEQPINDEELRGIAIFARGKMAQKPFFFNISGGISGQHALEYMSGQVKMDFIDDDNLDLISTERQRINLNKDGGCTIQKWGENLIKELAIIWKKRRAEEAIKEFEDKVNFIGNRLLKLPKSEQTTVKGVLKKLAGVSYLSKKRFQDVADQILTAWEGGRLHSLIHSLSEKNTINETEFINLLFETDVITSLHVAETVKTKLQVIDKIEEMVRNRKLENTVRDYIADHPWIIHPQWEKFAKEIGLERTLKELGDSHFNEPVYHGRIDLLLSSNNELILIEFMRPGLTIDNDHINRATAYVDALKYHISAQTAKNWELKESYIIAEVSNDFHTRESLKRCVTSKIYFKDWETLLADAKKQFKDFINVIKSRTPLDDRIQSL